MSRLIIPPNSLSANVQYEGAIPLLNDNFESIEGVFQGFVVDKQPAFPNNVGSMLLAPGALGVDFASVMATSLTDDLIFVTPRISIFVDPPTAAVGATTYDVNYLYPTGSALTPGQLKLVFGTHVGSQNIGGQAAGFIDGGVMYYYRNYISFSLRNADTVSHTYALMLNQSVYASGQNQFR